MTSNKSIEEHDLIENCLQGDETAWSEFYRKYYNSIKLIVSWRKWNFTDSIIEEIIQDVFLDLIKGLKAFKGQSTLLTYIQRITKNKCISALRRDITQKRKGERDSISYEEVQYKSTSDLEDSCNPSSIGKPEETVLKIEEARILRASVEQLSDNCKNIIMLRYYKDLSYEEIATKLDIADGTVCSRIKRCLLKLESIYKEMSSGFNVKR